MSNVFLDTFLASDLSADICFRNELFFFSLSEETTLIPILSARNY